MVALFKGFIATQRTNRWAAWNAAPAKANRCGTLPGEGACAILAVRNMARVSGGDDAPAASHVAHTSRSCHGAALGGVRWSDGRHGGAGLQAGESSSVGGSLPGAVLHGALRCGAVCCA